MSLHVFCHHPWDLISVMAPSSQHYFMHKKVEDAFSHFGPLKKKKKKQLFIQGRTRFSGFTEVEAKRHD